MSPSRSNPLRRAAEIAREQHRAIALETLLSSGLSVSQVKTATRTGILTRAHPEVYLFGPPPSSPYERAHAAVLAGRPTGLMSHEWCRWLLGVGRLPDHDPDVTTTKKRRGKGVTWHLTSQPPEPDANHDIPCTRPERMLIDLAPTLSPSDLRRLTNDVQINNLASAQAIREGIAAHPGRATAALKALVSDDRGATRSLLEDLLDELLPHPKPLRNVPLHGYEVDFHFPHLDLVIEADSWSVHGTKISFENDRAKWLDLEARGERVIPVSYRQVTTERATTKARLAAILT